MTDSFRIGWVVAVTFNRPRPIRAKASFEFASRLTIGSTWDCERHPISEDEFDAMTSNAVSPGSSPIVPLRLRTTDRIPYVRPPEISLALTALSALPVELLVERAKIRDSSHAEYVPSECVLYFVRHPPSADSGAQYELFKILRQRVLAAVPVMPRKVSGSGKPAEGVVELDIREAVLHKFQVLLCKDWNEYEENLDFYECRFNAALASLRATAGRDVQHKASRLEPLESAGAPIEPSPEVEKALLKLRDPGSPEDFDFLYRRKLLRAISQLPEKERRVIELILQEYQIESNDQEEETISTILGCCEKTVRNRRDSAYQKLHDVLKDAEENA